MGTLRDRLLAEATPAPWTLQDDPFRPSKAGELKATAKTASFALPEPYKRRGLACEARILERCLDALAVAKIWHLRIDQSGKVVGGAEGKRLVSGSHTGLSDIIACHEGRLLSIEVKAPGGRLSALQRNRLRDIIAAGGRGCVVVNPDRLIAWCLGADSAAVGTVEGIPVL